MGFSLLISAHAGRTARRFASARHVHLSGRCRLAGREHWLIVRELRRLVTETVERAAVRAEHALDAVEGVEAVLDRMRRRETDILVSTRMVTRNALRGVAAVIADRIDAGIAPARATVDVDPVNML